MEIYNAQNLIDIAEFTNGEVFAAVKLNQDSYKKIKKHPHKNGIIKFKVGQINFDFEILPTTIEHMLHPELADQMMKVFTDQILKIKEKVEFRLENPIKIEDLMDPEDLLIFDDEEIMENLKFHMALPELETGKILRIKLKIGKSGFEYKLNDEQIERVAQNDEKVSGEILEQILVFIRNPYKWSLAIKSLYYPD